MKLSVSDMMHKLCLIKSEEMTRRRCTMLKWDHKPATQYWPPALNLSTSLLGLFPITPCTMCRPRCQIQQGLWPPGNRGVSLTHMAQTVCFLSFSPLFLSPSLFFSISVIHSFRIVNSLPCVSLLSCCRHFLCRWDIFNTPPVTLEPTPLFVLYSSQACADRCGHSSIAQIHYSGSTCAGWNSVAASLKIPWAGWAPPAALSLSLKKECKDFQTGSAFSLSLLSAHPSRTAPYLYF